MEICSECGKEFANTRALGSHIHYVHRAFDIKLDVDDIRKKTFHKISKEETATGTNFMDTLIIAGADAMAEALIGGLSKWRKKGQS